MPEYVWTCLNMPEHAEYEPKRGKKIGESRVKKNETLSTRS